MSKPETASICQKAMVYYYDYLSSQRNSVPDDVRAHIEECPYCQHELNALQQIDLETHADSTLTSAQTTHLELHFALAGQPIQCSTIKAFLPVMAIPQQEVTVATPVTTHIDHCDPCREELRALKELDLSVLQYGYVSQIFSNGAIQNPEAFSDWQTETISAMLKRPDSGITTCFRLKDPLENESKKSFEVEVSTEQPAHTEKLTSVPVEAPAVHPVSSRLPQRRWLLRPLAAAAVLVFGILLLFQSPSVQATDIGQIYEALKNVRNIAMAQYDADEADPVQQTWISRSLNLKLTRTGESFALWNIADRTQKLYNTNNAQTQSLTLDTEAIHGLTKTMDAPYGLLPFKNTSELPPGAIWKKEADVKETEIYNLFWTQETAGAVPVEYQWQCHVDAVTKQPLTIKWGKKEPATQDYEFTTVIEITYPTEGQVKDVLLQIER